MKYSVQFQYKGENDHRPQDYALNDEIFLTEGQFTPLPNVGDSIFIPSSEEKGMYKVLTRHFIYDGDICAVNIVVTDLSVEELSTRIKE